MEKKLKLAIDASIEAGKEIMRIYEDPSQDFGIEMKADNSPLTLADKAAHACILRHLKPTGIPVLSEEGASIPYEERASWSRLWIVDPLDGTKEFIRRNGEFTVNIALVENGSPIIGVIYVPVTGIIYGGLVGYGARRVERNEFVTLPQASLANHAGYVVVASRSHPTPETDQYISMLRREHHDIQLISKGSSLKICLVAEGAADIYPRLAPTMEWDTAAGDAITRAAGKMVIDAHTGQPLTYNKPDLHNPWFIVQ